MFDGHGGREVAVYCGEQYGDILAKNEIIVELNQDEAVKEWLRTSFLRVDERLRTDEGQNAIGDMRRAKPPKKPPILSILQE